MAPSRGIDLTTHSISSDALPLCYILILSTKDDNNRYVVVTTKKDIKKLEFYLDWSSVCEDFWVKPGPFLVGCDLSRFQDSV